MAGDFTQGNIVVVRIGNGSTALNNSAHPVFLDEYTPTGTLVQSVPMPVSASGNNRIFTLSGSATSEGALTLSADRRYLCLAGYDAAPGSASVSTVSGVNRTIARVDSAGNVNTSTGFLAGSAYVTNNIRGAVTSDGGGFWCSGAGSNNTGGTWYLPFGSFTDAPVNISNTITNSRVINIFDSQLYVTSGSGNYRAINEVGSGLPTTIGQTVTALPGFPATDGVGSPYAFHLFDLNPNMPGLDVAYYCDDRATSGGIFKYSLVGGTWVPNGNITATVAIRGLAASISGNTVNLYLASEGGIHSLTDASGYNQTLSGTINQIATANTDTRFRGIALAPNHSGVSVSVSNINYLSSIKAMVSGETLTLSGLKNNEGPVQIRLTDLGGRVITSIVSANGRNLNEHISIATLPSGFYLVQINSSEGRLTKKVMITRP